VKAFLTQVLDALKRERLDYGDVRVVEQRIESLETKNGQVEGAISSLGSGFGVRVIVSGAWGFASSSKLEKAAVGKVVKEAVAIARASTLVPGKKVVLSREKPVKGKYRTRVVQDPFKVSLDEKLSVLLAADRIMRKHAQVKVARGSMNFFRFHKYFASTEGSWVEQEITESGAGITALAVEGSEVQVRSYPNSLGGDFASQGYEFVKSLALAENADQIAGEACALLQVSELEPGERDIIIGSSQLALQVHESIGHPVELDRVLGTEASYAGTSFVTLDKLDKLKYASPIVSVYQDATIEGALGSFGYDDEGVPAQRLPIIKDGLFTGYLTSRETAPVIGRTSSGAMRADGWNRIPLIRMTNINLEPGTGRLKDLIADTGEGIYFGTNKSWSIDDKRLNFQFGTEIAWEIKDGKLGRMFKNATYTGITPQFWNSCDAICGREEWKIWGLPNCGKGQPGQSAHVAHGAAPARFRKVRVGVRG
jgi:TldD protein